MMSAQVCFPFKGLALQLFWESNLQFWFWLKAKNEPKRANNDPKRLKMNQKELESIGVRTKFWMKGKT